MDFVIDRSKWRCGGKVLSRDSVRGDGETLLLNQQGFMCCLGQCSLQVGATPDGISNKAEPREVQRFQFDGYPFVEREEYEDEAVVLNSELAGLAMELNDDVWLTDLQRESQLAELFTKYGHTLTFTGEYYNPARV